MRAPPLAGSLQDQGPRFGVKQTRGKPQGCRGALCKFGIEENVKRGDLAIANNDDIQSGVVWGLAFRT
jgi:hypothetical protein